LKKSFSIGKQKHRLDELLVKDVMQSRVLWTTPSMSINDTAQMMMKHNVGALPILENDILVGMVTRTDVIKTIVL
jgi:CBS domain-containing protein